jgi:hypothetical protein
VDDLTLMSLFTTPKYKASALTGLDLSMDWEDITKSLAQSPRAAAQSVSAAISA